MSENREVKSDVFSMLMQEKKYALQVYNAVNGSHYEDPEEIEITTLKRGISLSIRNDASFILDMNLSIYEHQSTYSPNIPLRSLIYLVDIIKPLIADRDIFGRRMVTIPTPKFVVFYNGKEKRPAIETLHLSDAFENKSIHSDLELTCTIYNINQGMNEEMVESCQVLREYMQFINLIRELENLGEEAPIEAAIARCVEQGVLKEFLQERSEEVLKTMIIDMTFERREELIRRDERAEGRVEGHATGLFEGRAAGRIEGLAEGYASGQIEGKAEGEMIRLIRQINRKCVKGKTLEQIADELETTEDEIAVYYQLVLKNPEATAEEIYAISKME